MWDHRVNTEQGPGGKFSCSLLHCRPGLLVSINLPEMDLAASRIPHWSCLQLWVHVYLDVCPGAEASAPVPHTESEHGLADKARLCSVWEGGDEGERGSLYLAIFVTWEGNVSLGFGTPCWSQPHCKHRQRQVCARGPALEFHSLVGKEEVCLAGETEPRRAWKKVWKVGYTHCLGHQRKTVIIKSCSNKY